MWPSQVFDFVFRETLFPGDKIIVDNFEVVDFLESSTFDSF